MKFVFIVLMLWSFSAFSAPNIVDYQLEAEKAPKELSKIQELEIAIKKANDPRNGRISTLCYRKSKECPTSLSNQVQNIIYLYEEMVLEWQEKVEKTDQHIESMVSDLPEDQQQAIIEHLTKRFPIKNDHESAQNSIGKLEEEISKMASIELTIMSANMSPDTYTTDRLIELSESYHLPWPIRNLETYLLDDYKVSYAIMDKIVSGQYKLPFGFMKTDVSKCWISAKRRVTSTYGRGDDGFPFTKKWMDFFASFGEKGLPVVCYGDLLAFKSVEIPAIFNEETNSLELYRDVRWRRTCVGRTLITGSCKYRMRWRHTDPSHEDIMMALEPYVEANF